MLSSIKTVPSQCWEQILHCGHWMLITTQAYTTISLGHWPASCWISSPWLYQLVYFLFNSPLQRVRQQPSSLLKTWLRIDLAGFNYMWVYMPFRVPSSFLNHTWCLGAHPTLMYRCSRLIDLFQSHRNKEGLIDSVSNAQIRLVHLQWSLPRVSCASVPQTQDGQPDDPKVDTLTGETHRFWSLRTFCPYYSDTQKPKPQCQAPSQEVTRLFPPPLYMKWVREQG